MIVDNIYYRLNVKAKIATVTGYNTSKSNLIKIPEKINTIYGEFTVTRIDTLPNDVVEVIVPDTVTKIVRSCKYYKLVRVVLGTGIKELPKGFFEYCTNLRSVVINGLLKKIPDQLFADCKRLDTIKLPSSVEKIGECAFINCDRLRKIVIPQNTKIIEDSAFLFCTNLIDNVYFDGLPPQINKKVFSTNNKKHNIIWVRPEYTEHFINSKFNKYYTINTIGSNILKIKEIGLIENQRIGVVEPNLDDYGNNQYKGDIVIPKYYARNYGTENKPSYEYIKIIGIDDFAFADCIDLNSVEIHNDIVSISSSAFLGTDCYIINEERN